MDAVTEQAGFRRRELDIEDYLGILRRNVGWLVGPVLACLVISTVMACLWPNTYVSTAVIKIVPPTVPIRLVPGNIDVPMNDRIATLRMELLSHANLTNLIRTYSLYQKEQAGATMEDVIEIMMAAIKIEPLMVGTGTARQSAGIAVSFSYSNRFDAKKVTDYFVTRVINENERDASTRSKMATNFVKEKFDEAEARLTAADNAMLGFRNSNIGRLPEELNGNFQLMSSYDQRSSALTQNLSRIKNEITLAEGDLQGWIEKRNAAQAGTGAGASTGGGTIQALASSDPILANLNAGVAQLERSRNVLLRDLTPKHPDVVRLDKQIEDAKKERDQHLNSRLAISPSTKQDDSPTGKNTPKIKSREEVDADTQIARIQSKLKTLGNDEDQAIRDITALEKKISEVQQVVKNGPAGMQQYADLQRDQLAARKDYETWKAALNMSKTASDLQDNKQGELLEILNPASLPTSPTSPNRALFFGGGITFGILFGGALIAFRELRDTSIKTLKDVQSYTQLSILGSVPLLENDMVVRRRRRMAVLGWASASVVSLATMSAAAYYYLYVVSGR